MTAHNIPSLSTPFIGRDQALADITGLLTEPTCRLLTLTGPGGIGKTRLALEMARRLPAAFPDGVYFVPLQPLTSPDYIVSTIADALNFSFYGEGKPKHQLLNYLREKHLLLLMDNFEHLLDGADMLPEILDTGPHIKLLVTSRERLHLHEEWIFNMQGLPFPKQDAIDTLENYDAVQLFVQSARRVGYTLANADADSIAHICKLVEGIPLAIELAAAWVRVMPCAQIAQEIEHSLDILTTTTRNVPEKHRSMRAAFEHSWKLLTKEDQSVFSKLSVFRGGFMREAAQQVAGASLPMLAALVDKSLLRVDDKGRYSLQELLRQYAEYQLEYAGEAEVARDAHCAYYAQFLLRLATDLKGKNQINALGEIEAEIDNVRVAWGWAVARGKEHEILQSFDSLALFYQIRSRFHEAVEAFGIAAKRFSDTDNEVLGQSLMLQGWFSFFESNSQIGKELLLRGESILRRLGFHKMMPLLFSHLYSHVEELGGYEVVRQLYDESLVIFRQAGDEWRSAWALHGLGWYACLSGQQEEAWQLQQESLAKFSVLGDRWGSIWPLNTLGDWAIQRGDYHQARRLFEEGFAINKEIGDQAGIAWSLGRLSLTADSLYEADDFRKYLAKTLRATLAVNLSQRTFSDTEIYLIARWLEAEGHTERAVEMFAFCNCHPDLSSESIISMKAVHRLDALKGDLPPNVFAAAVQRGETRDIETVVATLSEILSILERQLDGSEFGMKDQPLIEALTERELEILQLIAEGLSNREIADHLILALSTVKWHINQIFSKLHANSRTQAIAHARALRLLA